MSRWSKPMRAGLTIEDARKLDEISEALQDGDIKRASRLAMRAFRLTPLGGFERARWGLVGRMSRPARPDFAAARRGEARACGRGPAGRSSEVRRPRAGYGADRMPATWKTRH